MLLREKCVCMNLHAVGKIVDVVVVIVVVVVDVVTREM